MEHGSDESNRHPSKARKASGKKDRGRDGGRSMWIDPDVQRDLEDLVEDGSNLRYNDQTSSEDQDDIRWNTKSIHNKSARILCPSTVGRECLICPV